MRGRRKVRNDTFYGMLPVKLTVTLPSIERKIVGTIER